MPETPRDEPIIIAASADGWEPSAELIEEVKAAARSKGLISDWPTIAALANHDLLLCCTHITGEFGADLIASKRFGKWTFKTNAIEYQRGV